MYIVLLLTGYAVQKLLQAQFANRAEPWRDELRVGQLPDAGLFWAVYGRAPVYETLLGASEALCVVLVLFRATRPFGALLTLAVMANVTAMNVSFGIGAVFNAASATVAALVLVVRFLPVYRQWLAVSIDRSSHVPFGPRLRRLGVGAQSLALLLAITSALVIWARLIRPMERARGVLYGRWAVVSGDVPSAAGVAPLRPGSIVMFNRLQVLAVRWGDLLHFGRYVEDDASSRLELSMHRVSFDDGLTLPPPGRLEERARALRARPLGYALRGSFSRTSDEQIVLRFPRGADVPPLEVVLRRQPPR
jgi:hypothetical protein